MSRRLLLLPIALLAAACASAPVDAPANRYGLRVVADETLYRAIVRRDPAQVLVPIELVVPGAVLDIRYATPDNFMKEPLYPRPAALLRCGPALALAAVQRDLAPRGLGLKVFDAYRPYGVTEKMWERFKDPDYVADPAKGSRHNRGAAVDVTLVELSTGRELPMPTPYDDFTPAASSTFPDVPEEARRNRATLKDAMEARGFVVLPSEWWHFDFEGWQRYDLLDLPHAALERLGAVGTSCGGPALQ
ncbi:MAG TPA: M15 family metallopeptidase [Thermoanaerobaculia bacterium]|nr:M15 family metallopeptidase [Thermoanaerobaculia bacterium]